MLCRLDGSRRRRRKAASTSAALGAAGPTVKSLALLTSLFEENLIEGEMEIPATAPRSVKARLYQRASAGRAAPSI